MLFRGPFFNSLWDYLSEGFLYASPTKSISATNPNRKVFESLMCVFGGAPREARLCVFLWSLMPASLAERLALLALWTSHAMCPLVVIDACVFGVAPREARCARLIRNPACGVDFTCYVSA